MRSDNLERTDLEVFRLIRDIGVRLEARLDGKSIFRIEAQIDQFLRKRKLTMQLREDVLDAIVFARNRLPRRHLLPERRSGPGLAVTAIDGDCVRGVSERTAGDQ